VKGLEHLWVMAIDHGATQDLLIVNRACLGFTELIKK